MQIEDRKEGDVLVAKVLDNRLDARIAVEFKEKMKDFINGGANNIVLNLSEVDFIDSSGLGAIVSSLKVLGRNGDFVISGTSDTVSTMFKLTRMDKVFRMFNSEDEAIAALMN
ncbi:MAG: STAS domain-containing protein [bacterium]